MFSLGDEMKTDTVRKQDEVARENMIQEKDVKKQEEKLRIGSSLLPTGRHGKRR